MLNVAKLVEHAPPFVRRLARRTAAGEGVLGRVADVVRFRLTDNKPPTLPPISDAPIRFFIGPTNSAGQGFQWARAVERECPGADAVSMMGIGARVFKPDVDLEVPVAVQQRSAQWHAEFEEYLAGQTHVVWESGRPLLGRSHGTDVRREMARLSDRGVRGALLFHGSDIRPPSRHAAQSEWSPFHEATRLGSVLEEIAQENAVLAAEAGVPVYVSTPDLLQWVPNAVWCPVVVDSERWRRAAATRTDNAVPVVVHAPSSKWLKGTDRIEPMLRRLSAEGVIEYRQIVNVPHAAIPDFYAQADIVLDQFVLGIYGVAACEAMASGRLVMSHVDAYTRSQVQERTGLTLPIHETTLASLESDLRRAASDPHAFDELRAAGPGFVDEVHDGRHSARALAPFLGTAE